MPKTLEARVLVAECKPMDDKTLVNHLMEFGAHLLSANGEFEPMIVGVDDNGTQYAFTLTSLADDKATALRAARALLRELPVTRYAALMESWFTQHNASEPIEASLPPSKSDQRQEAVTVTVCDKSGCLAFDMRLIERDSEGKATLGKAAFTVADDDAQSFGGAFTELLQ